MSAGQATRLVIGARPSLRVEGGVVAFCRAERRWTVSAVGLRRGFDAVEVRPCAQVKGVARHCRGGHETVVELVSGQELEPTA